MYINFHRILYIILFLFYISSCYSTITLNEHCIVFVHIGKTFPTYLTDTIKQARLFNACPIYLIANQSAINQNQELPNTLNIVPIETLHTSSLHIQFCENTQHGNTFRSGFWRFTTERFLYLYDFMLQYNISCVVHLENDVLIYVDCSELIPTLQKYYDGIAATFDNDQRCIPGFIYIHNHNALQLLASYFVHYASQALNDMQVIGICRNDHPTRIKHLPIIMPEYIKHNRLRNALNQGVQNHDNYCNNIEYFNSIFDAAALGQFLGGVDPKNGLQKSGFINESCIFNPAKLKFHWDIDNRGRKIPFAQYQTEKKYRINNLHIHSKNMAPFVSF